MTGVGSILAADVSELHRALSEQLAPRLREALEEAGSGHRLRVTTLPLPVMERLAETLVDARWVIRVLNEKPTKAYEASAATIIRLRDHEQRPVLVFFPPGPRTASEDSLDIATFTELSLATMARDLVDVLLARVDEPLRNSVKDVFRYLGETRLIRHADQQVDYLLTVLKNGGRAEAAGAAIYHFGLVPDFELFVRAGNTTLQWLTRNIQKCEKLADVNQPLQKRLRALGLREEAFRQKLFAFFRSRHTEEPRVWGKVIAHEADFRDLAFEKWDFAESEVADELRLVLDPLSLPRQLSDAVGGAERMPILNLAGKEQLKVAFRSIPPPSQAPAWKNWRVQILALADDGAAVAWESNSFPKPAGSRLSKMRRAIQPKDLEGLEEGTYFLRVDAYDSDGALLTTPHRIDPTDENSRAENESEPFLLVRSDSPAQDVEVRATFCTSLLSAWLRVAVKALDGRVRDSVPEQESLRGSWSQPIRASVKGDVRFDLESEGFAGFAIVVPGVLRRIEATLLESPRTIGLHSIRLKSGGIPGDVELVKKEQFQIDGFAGVDELLSARETLFRKIREHHHPAECDDADQEHFGVVEVVHVAKYSEAILEYARAFNRLIASATESDSHSNDVLRRALAWLDTIELRWRPQAGDAGRAILLSPTHPLRMLWLLQHSLECEKAIAAWRDGTHGVPNWRRYIEQLRDEIVPLNLPLALFDRRGRAYTEALPLTSFWALYLPDKDANGFHLDGSLARDRAIEALGINERSVAVTTVNATEIATRIFEFVLQHPYTDQLRINVFNPGNGQLIADVLRNIERLRRELPPPVPALRYAVHLFAPEGQLEAIGGAVEDLLDPDRHVGEDDEFTLDSGNHLHPKLLVARNGLRAFVAGHSCFPAHVSILVDQFSATARVGPVGHYRRASYVGGLVQEPDTLPLEGGDGFARTTVGWSKGINPFASETDDVYADGIAQTLNAMHRLQASIALGGTVTERVGPVLALQLDSEAKALLQQVHEVSDRVITLDRHLGIDFFDAPSTGREVGYLLDFSPEFVQEDRQRIVLTTRHTRELEAILSPMLTGYGIDLRDGDGVMVLEGLRSLSGRLALRLEGMTSLSKEVVGLLFARWLLEELGVLGNRIVIPLDAHRSWFDGPGPQRRADLLLVGFPANDVVRMDVVEVKLRDEVPIASRGALYRSMSEQTAITESRLRERFEPELFGVPRADIALRSKELAGIVAFYTRRAVRYGLLTETEGDVALETAERLDGGYRLDLHSSGVLFERLGAGYHVDEDEPGFVVHRFGADKARKLFHGAMGRFDDRVSLRSETESIANGRRGETLVETPQEAQLLAVLRDSLSLVRVKDEDNGSTRNEEMGEGKQIADGLIAEDIDVQGVGEAKQEPPVETLSAAKPSKASAPHADVLIGSNTETPQYGILGRSGSQSIALDLNGCNTISLFGVQGFGKSYTLGVIAEMASVQNPGLNALPSPVATVIFHFHKSDAYEPEYVTAVSPNRKQAEIDQLLKEYGATPKGLADIVLLTPDAKVAQRKADYPGIQVEPIKFSSSELGAESWKFLMGAYGNDSLYVRQLVAIMRRHRDGLTLDVLREEIASAELPKGALRLAEDRLALATPYIDDARRLGDLLRPGRTIIVDLRDEWIEKDEALGLFVVMLRIFAATKHDGKEFNKLVVFDEAHKYISESDLIAQVVETIREMRHQATSVIIASQDPLSVPRAIIELTSVLVLHRMTSPQWLKHLRSAIVALDEVSDTVVTSLQAGEALVWAQRSTDKRFTVRPQKVTIRPRFTQHGGGTKTAVNTDESH